MQSVSIDHCWIEILLNAMIDELIGWQCAASLRFKTNSKPTAPIASIPESKTEATTTTTTSSSVKSGKKSVPLLKDADKPGNPYGLLNTVFPPKDRIRTEEEEMASYNSLLDKDLGGLDASEVYVADDDLFVVRGFNYKKPYTADPAGPPIRSLSTSLPNLLI